MFRSGPADSRVRGESRMRVGAPLDATPWKEGLLLGAGRIHAKGGRPALVLNFAPERALPQEWAGLSARRAQS